MSKPLFMAISNRENMKIGVPPPVLPLRRVRASALLHPIHL
jgi:hypothetical protein